MRGTILDWFPGRTDALVPVKFMGPPEPYGQSMNTVFPYDLSYLIGEGSIGFRGVLRCFIGYLGLTIAFDDILSGHFIGWSAALTTERCDDFCGIKAFDDILSGQFFGCSATLIAEQYDGVAFTGKGQ